MAEKIYDETLNFHYGETTVLSVIYFDSEEMGRKNMEDMEDAKYKKTQEILINMLKAYKLEQDTKRIGQEF